VISTDGGITWTSENILRLWDNAGSPYVYDSIGSRGEHVTISLAGYSGTVMIGFYGESTVVNTENDLMIDNVHIFTTATNKTLNLTAFLEGLYASAGVMRQAFDYIGPHFGPGIADKVNVELHNAINYAIIEYSANNVNLTTGGNITISTIPDSFNGSYYITIRHRNSIETTSAFPVSFASGAINYDFSTAASQAYGSNLKPMGSYFVIYGGDPTQDGFVDGSDISAVDNASTALLLGYNPEDVNGDGIVDGSDMALVDNNSTAIVQSEKP